MKEEGHALYTNGMLTVREVTADERQKYMAMKPGIYIDAEVIRWVADTELERQILEQHANGLNRIRVKKRENRAEIE